MEFNEIVKDWQEWFPVLSTYTPPTLFAKTDIFLIGLRLEKDRFGAKEYSVYLEILPLWVQKEKIIIPFFMEELYDKKGFTLNIEYTLHDRLLTDYLHRQRMRGVVDIDKEKFELEKNRRHSRLVKAMEYAHKQFGSVLQENVGLNEIFRLIKTHTFSRNFNRHHHNPYDWYRIFELELALAYHFDRTDLIQRIKKNIDNESAWWDKKHFYENFNKSIHEWKEDLYRRMEDREAFMSQVESNLSLRKISKLNEIHIHDNVEPRKTLLQRILNYFN